MIEIVYKDEKQPTEEKTVNNLPKNVRQIGEPDSRFRVYMEDFAYTYLQKNGNYRPEQVKVCVLYGEEKEKDGQPVLFVQSAARLEVQEVQGKRVFMNRTGRYLKEYVRNFSRSRMYWAGR